MLLNSSIVRWDMSHAVDLDVGAACDCTQIYYAEERKKNFGVRRQETLFHPTEAGRGKS